MKPIGHSTRSLAHIDNMLFPSYAAVSNYLCSPQDISAPVVAMYSYVAYVMLHSYTPVATMSINNITRRGPHCRGLSEVFSNVADMSDAFFLTYQVEM